MIIFGGEPPFVEKPEPRFGEVILRLDQMAYAVEKKVASFNEGTKEALILFSQNMAQFVAEVTPVIDAHLAQQGAVHGETKASIGLGNKDNYRTATLAEQRALTPVLAYVTPQGAKQAFLDRNASNPLVGDAYQQNNVLQFASYFYTNEFPVMTPTVAQSSRYFDSNAKVAMVFNDDRIVYSPSSNKAVYQTDVGFISAPTKARKASRLAEIPNLQSRMLPGGWNNIGAVTSDGNVALFKPLADKKIFVYKDNLGDPAGAKNFLLFSSYIGTAYRGLSVFPQLTGDYTFNLLHKFFKVDAFESDPTLNQLVTAAYPALFTLMGAAPYQAPIQGGHTVDVRNFVTLSAGQTVKIGVENGSPQINVGLYWSARDYEIRMFVAVPLVVTGNGITKYLALNYVTSFIPGTLMAGGSGTVTVMGTRVPDTLNAGTLAPTNGSQYLFARDPFNFNDPSVLPGVVLSSGDVVRSISTKNGIRVKRFRSGLAGFPGWIAGPRPYADPKLLRTELYTPSRHSPFGPVPDRIIPFTNLNETRYLVYGLDNGTGLFRWAEITWNSESIVGSVAGARIGVRAPSSFTSYSKIDNFPKGLSVIANKVSSGVGINSLVFTAQNGFKANASFGYANGVVTLGAEVTLALTTVNRLKASGKKVLDNAAVFNAGIPDSARETMIHVYAITLNKAVVVISDGYSYAEGGAFSYNVAAGQLNLILPGSADLPLQRLTPSSSALTGLNRVSKSGDVVWSTPSDMLASQLDAATYDIVITRPFGEVYGDLSFRLSGMTSDSPTCSPFAVNPARLYQGQLIIDAVDELHPPILIPKKGLYQVSPGNASATSTIMADVSGNTTLDAYEVNEAGWVRIPGGSKVVIDGTVYLLDREYSVKVRAVGTSYCYLRRANNVLVAIASDVMREVSNTEVMFGTAVNGILTVNESYIVMNKHVLRTGRRGSAIPVFEDDGVAGTNKFFTRRDVS
jgi:hypothetical protein